MTIYWVSLAAILLFAGLAWVASVFIGKVSFVDSLWSLFFLLAALLFASEAMPLSARGMIVLALVAIWALRLCVHITARNWGEPEDYRYATIRRNNEPGFVVKSLVIVFGLQGLLAWIIAAPLLPAISSHVRGDVVGVECGASIVDTLLIAMFMVFPPFEIIESGACCVRRYAR